MAKMKAKSAKLNPSQRRFVKEYLKDQNGTQAYLRVYGGKKTSAAELSSRMLRNVNVATLIEKGLARLADLADITAERNIKRIAEFAYHKRGKASDTLKACELIGRTFGQFKDVVDNNVKGEIKVATQEEIDAAFERAKNKV